MLCCLLQLVTYGNAHSVHPKWNSRLSDFSSAHHLSVARQPEVVGSGWEFQMQPVSLSKNKSQYKFCPSTTALQSPLRANQGVQSLGAEALAQAAQGNLAVPSLAGWGLEKLGLVGGVPAHGSGWNEMSSKLPFNSNHSGLRRHTGYLHTSRAKSERE